ncbi:hypothetical protein C9374_009020 [Naegleria lovaniensis]|uniref:PH domain-containing protein n=1 Tax=Naegleria lovaniensis TaxID=51637 RepID=A0AA88KFM9_NAELO|nr:uncharacterized protein C9374_009020 [Naegleria lovaniensis]KAG2377935.1 hypothetical protein C9374_009020 [Naegleria lovaniensis]
MSQVDLLGASQSVSTTGAAAATAVQSPLGGRVKKSGKLVMENPKKKFFQKSNYKRFVVLTSKKILCFKDSEKVEKKPEDKIPLSRFSAIVDIDNHKGMQNSFGIRTALPSNSPYLDQDSSTMNNDDSPTSPSSSNKTFWFFAENPEERKSWIDTITNVIEELKESQTHLHLKVVKLIEQQNYNDVRQLILNGEYSKNAFLHFTKDEKRKSTDRGNRSASIAPGLREDDLSDDEDDEQVLTTEEIRQLTQMGYGDRDTILHIAVKNQDLKLVKFLLERDVDFNKKNKLDQTALHFIPISNGPGVFDPSTANRSGNLENSSEIPQLSLTGSSDNSSASNSSPRSGGVSPRGISPRSGGILRPRDELLQMILEKKEQRKININQFDKNGGFTALNLAARENEMDLVTKLVYENADPNLENDVGWTPMHYAVYNQNLRMLEVLTKRGGGKLLACSKRFVEPHDEDLAKYGNVKLEELRKYGKMSPLDMILSMLATATRKLMNASLLNSFNDRLATPGYKSTPVIPGLQTQPTQSVLQTINSNPSLSKILSLAKTVLTETTTSSISPEDLENHLKQLSSDENLDLFMDHLFVAIQFAEELSMDKCNLILKTLTAKVPKIVLTRFDVGSTISGMHSSTTFIHIAIRAKNAQALAILLNNPTLNSDEMKNIVNDCEKRAADGAEYTPLHNAMLHAPALTGILLDHGADCHKRSGKDLPIFLAVQCKELPGDVGARIVQAALDEEGKTQDDILNFSNSLGQSLLFFACQNSQLELVKKLVERGANSGAITNGNETVLSAAAYGGNLQVMEYLIDELKLDPSGSYEELYTENSYPPIHAATKNGHLEAVKLLVEKYGVSVNQSRHDLQMRPIHLCSISGKLDVAQYLVEKGCDCSVTINTREDKLLTPLHLAAGYGHPEIVKLLVEQGNYNGQFKPEKEDSSLKVDLNLIKTQNGVTPLELAMKRVQLNVVKYLCELGTVSDEHTLQLAIQSNNSEIIGWVEKRLGGSNEEKNRHLKLGSFDTLGLSVTSATPKSPQQ